MAHVVIGVEKGTPADRAGLVPGDALLAIDAKSILDVIDYELFASAVSPVLSIERRGERMDIRVKKGEYEPMGLMFGEPFMSSQRDCVNKCVFCFVDQLPPHVRPSLLDKDDDWRMSLMMGNFVTLTNVSDKELERIIARRCHPLYISVHATDASLRERIMGQRLAGKIMDQLRRLAGAGLTFHTQAVICPGVNDGEALVKTIKDLAGLRPYALSLALVPVGLTGHRNGLCPLRPFEADDAKRLLAQFDRFEAEHGKGFLFPADEIYLLAGREFPTDADYGDYDQIENGVGLCRRFAAEYEQAWRDADFSASAGRRFIIACGMSVAPFLKSVVEQFPVPGAAVEVRAVENRFFGPSVTVSGLLTGGDLIRELKGAPCDAVLITKNMLRETEDVFLDDMTLDEVSSAVGRVIAVSDAWELMDILRAGASGG